MITRHSFDIMIFCKCGKPMSCGIELSNDCSLLTLTTDPCSDCTDLDVDLMKNLLEKSLQKLKGEE